MSKLFLTSLDLAGNQLIAARFENLASFPSPGSPGRLVYNTTTALVEFDNGTAFRSFAPTDSPAFSGTPTAPTATTGTNTTQLATTAFVQAAVGAAGGGDMLKSVYDSDDDGQVDAADVADAAPWAGITGKPTVFPPDTHTHTLSDITDAGALAALNTVGTAQIADGAVTAAKFANIANSTILGRVSAGSGIVEGLTAAQVKTLLAMAIADVTGLQTALDGKAASSHTHTASDVTDFSAAVDARVVAYWDSIADTDASIDTIRELMDLVLANESGLNNLIGRHNADIGDGTSTSIAVTHNLGSLDVSVEVYEISTGATVQADIVRTNTNVVTIGVNPAPATDSLRVVIKK